MRAYHDILLERGDEAEWYRRGSPELEPWERGNTINGTTFARFRALVDDLDWRIVRESKRPVGSVGRMFERRRLVRGCLVSSYRSCTSQVSGVFLHRIAYILERP